MRGNRLMKRTRGSSSKAALVSLFVILPGLALAQESADSAPKEAGKAPAVSAERIILEALQEADKPAAEAKNEEPAGTPAVPAGKKAAAQAKRRDAREKKVRDFGPQREETICVPWGWYPWFGVPQTYRMKSYPPSITHVPRLGLQHTYLDALQMGIRVPDDSDPLQAEPNLGPFVGVVGALKAAAREAEEEVKETEEGKAACAEVLPLMKQGKYREAGKILADRFQESDDPQYPLLLTEVLFALGKPVHAEALLRHALATDDVLKALPADIGGHFAKPDDIEAKVKDLVASGQSQLLAAYFLLHSKSPDQGLDLLQQMMARDPKDSAPSILYRHYLGKAFKE